MVSRTRSRPLFPTLVPRRLRAVSPPSLSSCLGTVWAVATAAMGKTSVSQGPGARPDPVRSFNRWKKKHSHKQSQKNQLRKQLKKPEWQVEREVISRLMQNYEKVRPAPGRGRGPAAGLHVPAALGCTDEGADLLLGPCLGSKPLVPEKGVG